MFWDIDFFFVYMLLILSMLFFVYRSKTTTKKTIEPLIDISTLKSGDILLARWYPKNFKKRSYGFVRQFVTGGPWSHVGIIVSIKGELYVITTRPNYCTFSTEIHNEIIYNNAGFKPKSIVMTRLRDELKKYKSDGGWVAIRKSSRDIGSERILDWFKKNDRHFENFYIIAKTRFIQFLFGKKAAMNYYKNNNTGGTWCSAFIAKFLIEINRMRLPFDVHSCDPNHFSSSFNYITDYDTEKEIVL